MKWGDDSLRDKGLCGFDELILIQHWGPARSTVENGCSTMGEGEGRDSEGKVEERKRPGEKEKTRKKNERMELKEIKMEEKK